MKIFIVTFLVLAINRVENRMLSLNYVTVPTYFEETQADNNEEAVNDKILAIKNFDESDEYEISSIKQVNEKKKTPCSIVVLSNIQNPSMQSLLRKYRYDANGVLIPSSVKYFIKLPQGLGSNPLLVPLKDKAFSPQGGFVRYYKEVPPIPHLW